MQEGLQEHEGQVDVEYTMDEGEAEKLRECGMGH